MMNKNQSSRSGMNDNLNEIFSTEIKSFKNMKGMKAWEKFGAAPPVVWNCVSIQSFCVRLLWQFSLPQVQTKTVREAWPKMQRRLHMSHSLGTVSLDKPQILPYPCIKRKTSPKLGILVFQGDFFTGSAQADIRIMNINQSDSWYKRKHGLTK